MYNDASINTPVTGQTLGNWLKDRAITDGTKIAVDDRGVTTSYKELFERVEKLSAKLKAAGYSNGDTVVTVTGNSVDHIVVFFACAKNGLILCPLSWRLTVKEVAHLIERVSPDLVLYEDEYETLAFEALEAANVAAPSQLLGTAGVENEVPESRGSDVRELRDPLPDDGLLLIFTSGSEAQPKGVLLSHANCFWNNLSLAGASNFSANDVALCVLPQFHVGGWNIYPLLAIWSGATLILERTFQPKRVIDIISRRKVTVMMGVPTQYKTLSDDDSFNDADLSSLRMAQVGGAAISNDLLRTWEAKGIKLSPGYGLTEASPNVLFTPKESAVGGLHPYPHVRVRIDSQNVGEPGELQTTGPGIFLKYFDDTEATVKVFTEDGWLKTGDIAEYDSHGGIHIVGRIKDIFISGGENVAPAEIENALSQHPDVLEVAVVGMPDSVWGEVGCAFVKLKDSANSGTLGNSERELIMFARERLATFKIPKRIVILDEIPRIGIDKADRVTLRAMALKLSDGVNTK